MYNFLLFIYFLYALIKACFDYIFHSKKKKDLLKRLGLKKYGFDPKNKTPIIWVHAVSLGETKACQSLISKLKTEHPTSYIILSSVTETGHIEAKKSIADKCIYFPFDFSYCIKKTFSQIKPHLIIFIETDFWPNFLKEAKKNQSKLVLASAKMSLKSTIRFSNFLLLKFSKKLFSTFDLILTQNEQYQKRFAKFIPIDKIQITGNLKFVNTYKLDSKDILNKWLDKLNPKKNNLITIASTHFSEEEKLITILKDIPNLKILLAPRHPERFVQVYTKIQKITSCSLLSNLTNPDAKVILIDKMGILDILYQISSLAILGGSFIDRVGGHNILEPIFLKTPVFFGPYMHSQEELKNIALKKNCCKQTSFDNLTHDLNKYFGDKNYQNMLISNCETLKNSNLNILEKTYEKIKKTI